MNRFLVLLLIGVSASVACGQAPAFDAVSVKPGDPDSRLVQIRMEPDRFTATNAPLKMLIQFAYNLTSEDQLSDLPSALGAKGFDIDAKEDEALAAAQQKLTTEQRSAQIRVMVQALLADRFKLQASRQVKQLPIYVLVVSGGGLKISPDPVVAPPVDAAAPAKRRTMVRRGQITVNGVSMSTVADLLSRQQEIGGRIVTDKTGLAEKYSFDLKWTPESNAAAGNTPPADESAPTFFTAIQEQLGLKLEPQKGPVEVLVIDHIEAPSAN